MSLVSVRISLEADRIHDSLVVHQLVTFVIGEREELVVLGVSNDLMRFGHEGLTRFLLRLLEFVQDVLTHDVIIELGFALSVQTESSDFAFHVTILCGVSIILGTARHKFHDEIVGIQFARKLAEVIAQDWIGLTLFLQENNGVRVVVEDALSQLL